MTPPTALTIAGSDSGGGAGLQADLKTFAAFGVHGTSAVTAVTAQDTARVHGIHVLPVAFVDRQLDAVLNDFVIGAVKTGMLATAEIVVAVATRAACGELPNLVVDPVLVASSGDLLVEPQAIDAYLEALFPHAAVITPNLAEAGALVGRTLATIDDQVDAAQRLRETGARCVVVTGGDGTGGEAVDVVLDGAQLTVLRSPRILSANTHGTGCTFAAAIAAHLAAGEHTLRAIETAKRYVTASIRGAAGWRLGHGRGPLDHLGLDRRTMTDRG